ncbi:protein translocase subunit secE/sec61 gamma [Fontimonas thermophila]|uniref:Protein translocase subunit SecE n=1 Tax=Fontimonas thermophila TaxID=1076937 RepID=A0A1I2JI49_9GAMM|nr:preprotein translocase subunit SecE [Fontimonas thermophila]SFF52496.1 protein translocase subunit secE/sec61 gamma [Fontimonas thermophila]
MDVQTSEQKPASSRRDTVLLAVAAGALLGGMFAFYYFEARFNALVRTLMLLGGLAAGLVLAYQTAAGKTLWGYVVGSRIELRKIVWPTRQESVQATLMIAVVVLIMALLLWGLDSVLLWGVETLTGRGS